MVSLDPHYLGLLAGYAAAGVLILVMQRLLPPSVLSLPAPQVSRPWLDLALLLLAVAAALGIGQAYSADLLFDHGNPILESLNQLAIFSPILIVLMLRPGGISSAFLPLRGALGLPVGIVVAGVSLLAYAAARGFPEEYAALAQSVVAPKNAKLLVQVALEDIAIAALLTRLVVITGRPAAIVVVAVLFAAAHVPAMLAKDVIGAEEWIGLAGDTVIGVLILSAILMTRSIWWFVPVHFAMDMTQFFQASGP